MALTRSLGAAKNKVAEVTAATLVVFACALVGPSAAPSVVGGSRPTTLLATSSAKQVDFSPGVKMTLPKSVPPSPQFLKAGLCGVRVSTDTATCAEAVIEAIDSARKTEPLNGLPASFSLKAFLKLTYDEQIFAIADIERTARGLPAIEGITTQLDTIAQAAAVAAVDPPVSLPMSLNGGGVATYFGSNWAGATANALGADYFWMYDDGPNSPNADCPKAGAPGCWAHRENVLGAYFDKAYCPASLPVNAVMGVGQFDTKLFQPSIVELFMNDCGPAPTMFFTWPDVQRLVFGH
jgi:hypothetical protein